MVRKPKCVWVSEWEHSAGHHQHQCTSAFSSTHHTAPASPEPWTSHRGHRSNAGSLGSARGAEPMADTGSQCHLHGAVHTVALGTSKVTKCRGVLTRNCDLEHL